MVVIIKPSSRILSIRQIRSSILITVFEYSVSEWIDRNLNLSVKDNIYCDDPSKLNFHTCRQR